MIHLRNPDDATLISTMKGIVEGVRNRSALAREVGVSRTTLYKWLEGKVPTLGELTAVAMATHTPIRIEIGPETDDNHEALTDRISRLESTVNRLVEAIDEGNLRLSIVHPPT